MKLTEAKIKQLIKEMMEDKPLPHLDKSLARAARRRYASIIANCNVQRVFVP